MDSNPQTQSIAALAKTHLGYPSYVPVSLTIGQVCYATWYRVSLNLLAKCYRIVFFTYIGSPLAPVLSRRAESPSCNLSS